MRRLVICRIFTIVLAISLLSGGLFGVFRSISIARAYAVSPLTTEQLSALDLSHTTHLMIVAHPDDETLWGGAHLIDGGYFVVCITNGNNATRNAEFQAVMKASGNVGLILSYPDKVAGKRDDWTHVRVQLQKDLELILNYQSWADVVTHNSAGEYGHIHHKMTHQLVVACYDADGLQMPLFVFGKYYRASVLSTVQDTLEKVSTSELRQKEALLQLYSSQKRTISGLSHMNAYELWTQIRGGETNA